MHPASGFLRIALAGAIASSCGCGGGIPLEGEPGLLVFAPEGNRLHAYDLASGRQQVVIPNSSEDPGGRDINGPVCFFPDGSRRFVAAEDTGQPANPQGWGIFELRGDRIGEFSATQIGKLVPTYQTPLEAADPYGCAFLPDGRLLTTDIGYNASGPASGQLTVWFPPLDRKPVAYCKLDIALGTAGGVFVDADETVYVASARVNPGIFRYRGPLPTAADAAGGCGRRDATGAPLVTAVEKTRWIADPNTPTPTGVVRTRSGTFYVASVLNGVIAEFDAEGNFLRRILEPPGSQRPYATGSPFALAVDPEGTLYYADLALVTGPGGIGPGRKLGTIRRIRFQDGQPLAPETIDRGLDFPDGLGLLVEPR